MPVHSSINYHRSEFLANPLKQKEQIIFITQTSKQCISDYEDDVDPFDTSWTYAQREGKPSTTHYKNARHCYHCHQYYCRCDLQQCSHERCQEHTSKEDRKALVKKYISAEELNKMNDKIIQAHLQENRYCSCLWLHVPPNYPRDDMISYCTIMHFDMLLGKEVEAHHKQAELEEKIELLAKYGLTLAEYEEMKRTKALGV